MTYTGVVQDGLIVIEGGARLENGTRVTIETVDNSKKSIRETLLKWAGKAEGLPADSSVNLDHYLYGLPKK